MSSSPPLAALDTFVPQLHSLCCTATGGVRWSGSGCRSSRSGNLRRTAVSHNMFTMQGGYAVPCVCWQGQVLLARRC